MRLREKINTVIETREPFVQLDCRAYMEGAAPTPCDLLPSEWYHWHDLEPKIHIEQASSRGILSLTVAHHLFSGSCQGLYGHTFYFKTQSTLQNMKALCIFFIHIHFCTCPLLNSWKFRKPKPLMTQSATPVMKGKWQRCNVVRSQKVLLNSCMRSRIWLRF